MKSDLAHVVAVLCSESRSSEDKDYLYSQLLLLGDLRQYLYDLSEGMKERLVSALQLEHYHQGYTLFRKGDRSDKMYVVLFGALDMFDESFECPQPLLIATLGPGKMIGERGLVKRTTRLLTAITRADTYLLSLDVKSFGALLGPAIAQRMEEKALFVEKFLPRTRPIHTSVKERIVYALSQRFFRRGTKLLTQGDHSSFLYFIKSGECSVTTRQHTKIVTLTTGCWCGEESIFLNRPSAYTVTVSSEAAWLYTLTASEAVKLIPETTAEIMRQQCAWKDDNRRRIQLKMSSLAKLPIGSIETHEHARFRLASASAKRSLLKVVGRSPSSELEDVRTDVRIAIKLKLGDRGVGAFNIFTPLHRRVRSDLQILTERSRAQTRSARLIDL